ncbi:hypothetical protein C8T65DRAFT_660432 [Cerioporus squamosus]|nr:hypothetical protein C8T65DRAFT_660432 [Cerioporus squamosus]
MNPCAPSMLSYSTWNIILLFCQSICMEMFLPSCAPTRPLSENVAMFGPQAGTIIAALVNCGTPCISRGVR